MLRSTRAHLRQPVALLLAAVALLPVLLFGSSTRTASADTAANQVVTRVTTAHQTDVAPNGPLTGLQDLDVITVNVTADGSGAPPANNIIFGMDARLCRTGLNIQLLSQFNASAGNCIANPLSTGSTAIVQQAFAPPNTSGTLSYIVGTGAETVATHVGPGAPIVCGPGNPCALWLRQSVPTGIVPSGNAFVHYDLEFASTATAPGKPMAVSASAGTGQATVSWTAPADTGSSAITGYTVTSSPGGLTCTTATTSCAVTGLTDFTPYTFTVTATNGDGLTGPASDPSAAVTPRPSAPVVSSAVAGDASATISWSASSPAPTAYTVTSSPGSLTCTTATTSCTVSGLTNATSYTFTVRADYPAGSVTSAPSAAVVPAPPSPGAPGAPTGVTATAGNEAATVSWTPPVDTGNSAISSYAVTSSPAGGTCATNATSCTVTGLDNFTAYTFTVTATNAASFTGPPGGPSGAVTPRPTVPVVSGAVAGDASATITWSASTPAPTDYTVTSSPGSLTCTTATTSCTVSGLTNATSYTFTVRADYPAGSVTSAPSASVTPTAPAGPPGAPTGVAATPGNGEATVSWTAPGDDGGSPITSYAVSATSPTGSSAQQGNSVLAVAGTCTTATTSCTVTGLSNFTTYSFTVTATNGSDLTGPASAPTAEVTPLPTAPVITSVEPGDGSVTVTWSAADPAPTGYAVEGAPDGSCTTATETTCTITGLTNATSYTFRVTATYPEGEVTSVASAAVEPAVPTTTTTTGSTATPTSPGAGDDGTGSGGSSGTLPVTGSDPVRLTVAGLLLVLTGVGLVVVTRRRRLGSGVVGR